MTNKIIAQAAIALLKTGIKYKNKEKILAAYDKIDDLELSNERVNNFSWDNLDALFSEWDDLVSQANDIIYSN